MLFQSLDLRSLASKKAAEMNLEICCRSSRNSRLVESATIMHTSPLEWSEPHTIRQLRLTIQVFCTILWPRPAGFLSGIAGIGTLNNLEGMKETSRVVADAQMEVGSGGPKRLYQSQGLAEASWVTFWYACCSFNSAKP